MRKLGVEREGELSRSKNGANKSEVVMPREHRAEFTAAMVVCFILARSVFLSGAPLPNQNSLITQALRDPSESTRASAVKEISERMRINPADCAQPLTSSWARPLRKAGYNKELAEWSAECLTGSTSLPQIVVEGLLSIQVQALVAIGKNDEALPVARSLYNVIRLKNIDLALRLIAKCIPTDGSNADVVASLNGETSNSGGNEAASVPKFIKSINVDGVRYQKWIDAEAGDNNESMRRQGLRLLIADRPAEARKIFQAALEEAATPDRIAILNSWIARTFRAEDGDTVREVDYLRRHPTSRPVDSD